MNEIIAFLRQILGQVQFWVIVAPWDEGLRVRVRPQWTKHLKPGIHLKLPLIDKVFIQSVRKRIATLPRQTVTIADGRTVTFTGAIQYAIGDIRALYNSVHHPEDTIQQLAKARIAEVLTDAEGSPHPREVALLSSRLLQQDIAECGLTQGWIFLSDFAVVRTYRLIGDSSWGSWGSSLNTETEHGAKA